MKGRFYFSYVNDREGWRRVEEGRRRYEQEGGGGVER